MKRLVDLNIGCYQAGNSWLHRVDARSKILVLPLLIMTCFSASTWSQFLLLVVCAAGLISSCRVSFGGWCRSLRPLRWLLLTTILIHLFFSPGKTLFGTTWLSEDGLLIGVRTALQLCLAMSFASLLSLTTSPEALTTAFAQLLKPLQRFGVPTDRLVDLLGLVLAFVPILREESRLLLESRSAELDQTAHGSLLGRGRAISSLLEPLVIRLADRADQMAFRLAAGERLVHAGDPGSMTLPVQVATASLCLLLIVWMVL